MQNEKYKQGTLNDEMEKWNDYIFNNTNVY